jgi:hypothetical protein
VLEAELLAGLRVGRVRVICAAVLYDSTESGGAEISMHEATATEARVAADEHVYALSYRDTGMRTGPRPQLTVSTETGEIRVTRAPDVASPFTAVLRVEPWSTPRPGPALGASPAQASEPSRSAPSRCDLAGSWEGRVRDGNGEQTPFTLAPSRTTSTVVRRNGRLVRSTTSESDPEVLNPIGPSGPARLELACADGRASAKVGDTSFEGRFGPDGMTFLGRVTGPGAPATFWLRRKLDDEPTAADIDVEAVVREALRER